MADDPRIPPGPGSELPELAIKTVDELLSRLGVDAAIVIVMRKTDGLMGVAARSPVFNTETLFAIGVKSLVDVREKGVKEENAKLEKGQG